MQNTGKYLLVDDGIVEDIWNVRRQLVRPTKCIDNPLIIADRPWEAGGVTGAYVLFDTEEQITHVLALPCSHSAPYLTLRKRSRRLHATRASPRASLKWTA